MIRYILCSELENLRNGKKNNKGILMPKDNRNFFEKKKDWSEIKDTLLGAYLKPYFQKILTTRQIKYILTIGLRKVDWIWRIM